MTSAPARCNDIPSPKLKLIVKEVVSEVTLIAFAKETNPIIEEYKKKNKRYFPTWTEVLEVINALGYRKVADPKSLEELSTCK